MDKLSNPGPVEVQQPIQPDDKTDVASQQLANALSKATAVKQVAATIPYNQDTYENEAQDHMHQYAVLFDSQAVNPTQNYDAGGKKGNLYDHIQASKLDPSQKATVTDYVNLNGLRASAYAAVSAKDSAGFAKISKFAEDNKKMGAKLPGKKHFEDLIQNADGDTRSAVRAMIGQVKG